MSIRSTWHQSRARQHARNTIWPWSMLVISVALIFFHLGKVSHPTFAGHPIRRDVKMASPILPIPQFKTKPKVKIARDEHWVKRPRKKLSKRSGSKVAKPVSVGNSPKLVRE